MTFLSPVMGFITSWELTDFSKLENCIKFLEHKGVTSKKLVTFFGPTSAGKSALVNELVGAYVQESQGIPTTSKPAVVIKATESEFSRLCDTSLENVNYLVKKHPKLELFPEERPELSRATDPRYGVVYCKSHTPRRHLEDYGLPTVMNPEVTVVNGKYVEWMKHKTSWGKGDYGKFQHDPSSTPVYLDTRGFNAEEVSSPKKKENHNESWSGLREWMGASAFKVVCLPAHTEREHRSSFLQIFEDQMRGEGMLEQISEKITGDKQKSPPYDGNDIWDNTILALTQVDISAAKGWRGLMDFAFEGGQPVASLRHRLHANKVRYLSLPTHRRTVSDSGVRTWLDGEWEKFNAKLEANTMGTGNSANSLVCKNAKDYFNQVRDESSYKACLPHQTGFNDNSYYAKKIGKMQKCPGDWWA
eukprot:TRINITY_DN2270_c0_g1_i4.p1 TRINITY_DN2270_c0_g1~~TRINITY_DN2270_c0_g1_i4.p1  ORF type:complete len:417 (+),score=61.54 TRINITY_DN2270_c0_g1_i4:128-1378(+)